MVVLMPRADVLTQPGTRADNLKAFEPLLLNEMIPEFEQRYRVDGTPLARAIAGNSLGGELAFSLAFKHPELFRWAASLSGSIFERELAERYGSAYEKSQFTNATFRLLWMGCGSDDAFMADTRKLSELLKANGVNHTFREYGGGHAMTTFRRELLDLLPLLFR
jgi:enterochelin esterase-like enzyme